MTRFIVDRIIEDVAILERDDMTHIEVSRMILPAGIKEGSVVQFDGTEYSVDLSAEKEIRERISLKQKRIFIKK